MKKDLLYPLENLIYMLEQIEAIERGWGLSIWNRRKKGR